jgi:hypothetical protein
LFNSKTYQAIFAGTAAGIFLGLFLKFIQFTTSLKVYTLLLNVDYIPILNRFTFPESVEFGFHLIISIILGIIIMKFLPPKQHSWIIMICIVIGILLFPTTALSSKTPAINDYPALYYWLVGHTVYGMILRLLLKREH